jgi:8-amino-7-oxononanoate synthase
MADLFDKLQPVAETLSSLPSGTPRPCDTTIEAVLGPCEVVISGRRTLMFGSNNYLGLTFHPDVLASAKEAVDRYGSGTTGSRVANGSLALHSALEQDFVELFAAVDHRIAHAKIFTTGHQANTSVIAGLVGPDDTLLIDAESHASIWDGGRLSGAPLVAFRHNSPGDLGRRLARLPRGHTNRLVVVEGLYSIRGDVAPVRDVAQVCREHGAYLMVDEAHSFGVYGPHGLGLAEEQNALADVDFLIGTFSKSLGSVGGFAVSRHEALSLLHFVARSYMFTASGSAANVAAVRTALRTMAQEPERRTRLWQNVRQMRAGLTRAGFAIGPSESPIVPIFIGDMTLTIQLWQALLQAGLYVNIVLPPGCPSHECLLRTSYSAAHSADQIDEALDILVRVSASLGIPRALA